MEINKNLDEVTNKALKTGEKIITINCPCCGKSFYVTEDEAAFFIIIRDKDDFTLDQKSFTGKILGRKCPHCGFAGSFSSSNFFALGRGSFISDEIEAEQRAQEAFDESRTPWSEINKTEIKFED